jgi:MmgE/PrpD C-terminal domain
LPQMLAGLGQLWVIQTLQIKTVPCCHYFQTACTAATRLTAGRTVAVTEVERIVVDTTKLGDEVTRFARDYAGGKLPLLTPVGAGFDLALALAIQLHAGQLTAATCEASYLTRHADSLRQWYQRIEIRHDPTLTMRVVDSGSAIAAGRAAIRTLTPRTLLQLVMAYRANYKSSLLRTTDFSAWVKTVRERRAAPSTAGAVSADGSVALAFPNRVTITWTDGRVTQAEQDLPDGAIMAPTMPAALRTKFVREATPRMGREHAEAGYQHAMTDAAIALPALIAGLTARR